MPKNDPIWEQWTVVSGTGGKARVKCNHCGNEQLKNAAKCKRHVVKCQHNQDRELKERVAIELRIRSETKRLMADSDGAVDAVDNGEGVSGQVAADINNDVGTGDKVDDNVICMAKEVQALLTKSSPFEHRKGHSIWRHWVDVSAPEGDISVANDGKQRVKCTYCANVQLKNAVKCKRHTIQCAKSPAEVKRRYLNEQNLKAILSVDMEGVDVMTGSAVKLREQSLREDNERLTKELAFRGQLCSLLESEMKYFVKCLTDCQTCGQSEDIRNRLTQFEQRVIQLKSKRVVSRSRGSVSGLATKRLSTGVVRKALPPPPVDTEDDNSLTNDLTRFATNITIDLSNKPIDGLSEVKRFRCDSCAYESGNKQRLESHVNRVHLQVRPFRCPQCDKEFLTNENLIHHCKNIHANPEDVVYYRCDWPECQFTTRYRSSLTVHRLQHLGIKEFVCQWPGCAHAFYTNKDLRKHRVCHTTTYRCEWVGCGAQLKSGKCLYSPAANLKRHKLSHTTDSQRPYPCPWPGCDKRFQFSSFLTLHERRHRGDRPHTCPHVGCDKTFFDKTKMLTHLRSHTDRRDYPCIWPGCEATYKTSSHLERHVLTHSTDESTVDPLTCQWPGCGKQFNHKRNLNTHIRYHKSERIYPCDWPDCERRFKSKDVLRAHLMAHRGDRPYRCSWEGCERRFIRRTLMVSHYRSHESEPAFECERSDCGKKFRTNGCLQRHQRQVHGGQRRTYRCDVEGCDRAFSRRQTLVSHAKSHANTSGAPEVPVN